MYIGMVSLDSEISGILIVRNASDVPTQADAAPSMRVYGEDGTPLTITTLSNKESKAITGATNTSPIVVTSAAHGLTNGLRVTVAGVGGNTAANGTFTVANKTTDTFELSGSTGNGAYTSGGTWTLTGAYAISLTPTSAAGYAVGTTYSIVAGYQVSSTSYAQVFSFTVV